jgi:RecA/RadA recombinase
MNMARSTRSNASRRQAISAIANAFKDFRPARTALKIVRAVPTCFPQLDHVTRVGGWPICTVSVVHGPSNEGKAQPIDEPVLTPDGWVAIGSLREGDHVIGSSGRATRVTGIFPQGRKPIFRVLLDDGTSTRCCKEHLWHTTTIAELNRGRYTRGPRPERRREQTGEEGAGSVKDALRIGSSLDECHYLPRYAPVHFTRGDRLPLDPYYLGVLLGDGCLRHGAVTITSMDLDLLDRVGKIAESLGDVGKLVRYEGKCPIVRIQGGGKPSKTRQILETLGVYGAKSDDKHVPDAYLYGSAEERLELLRGLMDTDGTLNNSKTDAVFCSTSTRLRDAVLHLVRSLGGRATTWVKETTHLPAWLVGFSFADGTCPFWLKRKADLWRKDRKRAMRRRIVDVQQVGDAECVCIRVEAEDSLYLTRDFIPTHNSLASLGLIGSFLALGHFALFIDAERTTPLKWAREVLGDLVDSERFFVEYPPENKYEAAVDKVREFLVSVTELRNEGVVPKDTTAIVVVDSISKLTPEDLVRKIAKEGAAGAKGSIDGAGGRAGQIRAGMNSAWLDMLTPLCDDTGTAALLIARETDDPEADFWEKKFGNDYRVKGGRALIYDSSLVLRVQRAGWVYDERGGDKKLVAERHRVTIRKTKVGGKAERTVTAYFHSVPGVDVPRRLDRARDVLELADRLGTIELSNGRVPWSFVTGEPGRRVASMHDAVAALNEDPGQLSRAEVQVRACFEASPPVEHTEDGEVIDG